MASRPKVGPSVDFTALPRRSTRGRATDDSLPPPELPEKNAGKRPPRASKTAAKKNAVWQGAAPVGPKPKDPNATGRKRSASNQQESATEDENLPSHSHSADQCRYDVSRDVWLLPRRSKITLLSSSLRPIFALQVESSTKRRRVPVPQAITGSTLQADLPAALKVSCSAIIARKSAFLLPSSLFCQVPTGIRKTQGIIKPLPSSSKPSKISNPLEQPVSSSRATADVVHPAAAVRYESAQRTFQLTKSGFIKSGSCVVPPQSTSVETKCRDTWLWLAVIASRIRTATSASPLALVRSEWSRNCSLASQHAPPRTRIKL
ncbi:hypothetical protein B0H13DRAFT_1894236 [Mycena leptocephala]|nr:hypothetical protein B0H13DRAFT_1894236 [Mycena leptocephala]